MSEAGRTGRWRTGEQSRQRILVAARERFMRDGYEQATVRRIATDAGVDVAMVYYFFGNKEGLFSASVLTGPAHPLHQLATLLDEGTEQIGPRLVRRLPRARTKTMRSEPLLAAIAFRSYPASRAKGVARHSRRSDSRSGSARSSGWPIPSCVWKW